MQACAENARLQHQVADLQRQLALKEQERDEAWESAFGNFMEEEYEREARERNDLLLRVDILEQKWCKLQLQLTGVQAALDQSLAERCAEEQEHAEALQRCMAEMEHYKTKLGNERELINVILVSVAVWSDDAYD